MTTNHPPMSQAAYRDSGVDTDEAEIGLARLISRITRTWPPRGSFGGVELPIGYFANVIDIGGIGLAICTDGVGSKVIIAQLMQRYDTIGIDCIAMNVNDLICVGAQPISLVDYIAVEQANAQILEAIAIGLADGADQAGISISGGETAQLEDVVHGFDLAGTAVGTVPLDKIRHPKQRDPQQRADPRAESILQASRAAPVGSPGSGDERISGRRIAPPHPDLRSRSHGNSTAGPERQGIGPYHQRRPAQSGSC